MLTNLRAGFARNKKTLAILGAVAVAGFALLMRNRAKTTAAAAAPATSYSNGAGATSSTPYATTSTSTYDSTASDVYNSLQPQLEQLQQMLNQTPVPNTSASPSVPDGFYQAAGDQAIFQAKNGVLDFLTHDEAVALGSPTPTIVTKRDPIWNAPLANPGKTIPWVHQQ